MFKGQYRIWHQQKIGLPFAPEPDLILPNLIPDAAWDEYLKMIFQNVSEIAGGANWYVGLCEQTPDDEDVLTDITSEPTVTNGYARQSLARNATGWPTLVTINGKQAIRSAAVTFAASGGDFSATFNRLFLTDQSSGTGGVLYSYSGALTTPVLVTDGNNVQYQYELLANQ